MGWLFGGKQEQQTQRPRQQQKHSDAPRARQAAPRAGGSKAPGPSTQPWTGSRVSLPVGGLDSWHGAPLGTPRSGGGVAGGGGQRQERPKHSAPRPLVDRSAASVTEHGGHGRPAPQRSSHSAHELGRVAGQEPAEQDPVWLYNHPEEDAPPQPEIAEEESWGGLQRLSSKAANQRWQPEHQPRQRALEEPGPFGEREEVGVAEGQERPAVAGAAAPSLALSAGMGGGDSPGHGRPVADFSEEACTAVVEVQQPLGADDAGSSLANTDGAGPSDSGPSAALPDLREQEELGSDAAELGSGVVEPGPVQPAVAAEPAGGAAEEGSAASQQPGAAGDYLEEGGPGGAAWPEEQGGSYGAAAAAAGEPAAAEPAVQGPAEQLVLDRSSEGSEGLEESAFDLDPAADLAGEAGGGTPGAESRAGSRVGGRAKDTPLSLPPQPPPQQQQQQLGSRRGTPDEGKELPGPPSDWVPVEAADGPSPTTVAGAPDIAATAGLEAGQEAQQAQQQQGAGGPGPADMLAELELQRERHTEQMRLELRARQELEEMLVRIEKHYKAEQAARRQAEELASALRQDRDGIQARLEEQLRLAGEGAGRVQAQAGAMAAQQAALAQERAEMQALREAFVSECEKAQMEVQRAQEALQGAEEKMRAAEQAERARLAAIAAELDKARQELASRTEGLGREMTGWRSQAEGVGRSAGGARRELGERRKGLEAAQARLRALGERWQLVSADAPQAHVAEQGGGGLLPAHYPAAPALVDPAQPGSGYKPWQASAKHGPAGGASKARLPQLRASVVGVEGSRQMVGAAQQAAGLLQLSRLEPLSQHRSFLTGASPAISQGASASSLVSPRQRMPPGKPTGQQPHRQRCLRPAPHPAPPADREKESLRDAARVAYMAAKWRQGAA